MPAVKQQCTDACIPPSCAPRNDLSHRLWLVLLLASLTYLPSTDLWGHGSVVDAGDGCVIQFDFYSAHFAIFQPQTRGHRAFCEDIPDVSESVFVMEYLHNSLREVPVDFRLIRNETPLGRFVRWPDIEAMGDLSGLTVFHQRYAPQTDGVLRVMHSFTQAGDYIGIVTVAHPTLDLEYHAVFPFRVGRSWRTYWAWGLPGVALLLVLYRQRRRSKRSTFT